MSKILLFRVVQENDGLTLVELMIVMVLSLLLMSAVYMTFQLQQSSGQAQLQVTATQQDLRAAMDVIAIDIMHAGVDPTISGTVQGIPAATSGLNALRMTMDMNSDGDTADGDEDVIYSISADGNLERNNVNSGIQAILANNVLTLNFTYRDETRAVIAPAGAGGLLDATQAAAVRYIDVVIRKRSDERDPQTGGFIERELQRTVCRRNGWPS